MTGQPTTRRRGLALENAILDAVWTELATFGYPQLTFEAVGRRAGTSRTVLYRRWPTRAALALAAIERHVKQNPLTVPDLGNIRDEACLLLRRFADRAPPKLLRLIFEMSDEMAAENASFYNAEFREDPLADLIDRAVRRGEVDERRLTQRVLRTPLSLVMHEIILTSKEISDEAIAEIVDQVFLPLVTHVG